jgi:hypothetical protein
MTWLEKAKVVLFYAALTASILLLAWLGFLYAMLDPLKET